MCVMTALVLCACAYVCVCVHYLQACLSVIQPIEWQEELVLQPAGRDYYGWLIYKVISTHWCRRPRSAHNAAARVLEAALGLCVILFFFCRASSLNSCGPRRKEKTQLFQLAISQCCTRYRECQLCVYTDHHCHVHFTFLPL